MSRSTDAVKAIYDAFGKGDVPAILARLAPEVAWEHDWGGASLRWFEQRRGRDAVPAFFATLADFEFIRFEPSAFLEGDHQVAVSIRLELVCKANGRRIRDLEMHLWTFGPDGLVTGFRHFVDTQQWAQATRTCTSRCAKPPVAAYSTFTATGSRQWTTYDWAPVASWFRRCASAR